MTNDHFARTIRTKHPVLLATLDIFKERGINQGEAIRQWLEHGFEFALARILITDPGLYEDIQQRVAEQRHTDHAPAIDQPLAALSLVQEMLTLILGGIGDRTGVSSTLPINSTTTDGITVSVQSFADFGVDDFDAF